MPFQPPACHLATSIKRGQWIDPGQDQRSALEVGMCINSMLLMPCYTNKRYYYYLPFEAFRELMKKHPLGFQVNDVLRYLEGSGPFRNSYWAYLSPRLKPFSWIYFSESLKCLTSLQSQTKGSWEEMERNQIDLICGVLWNAHTCVCIWVSMDIHVWRPLVGNKVETWS